MYDVVPQMHQPVDADFAFQVNGTWAHSAITQEDLTAEGQSWGLRNAKAIVDDTVDRIQQFVLSEIPLPGSHHVLVEDIIRFCRNLQAGRGASEGSAPLRVAMSGDRGKGLTPLQGSDGGWGGPVRR